MRVQAFALVEVCLKSSPIFGFSAQLPCRLKSDGYDFNMVVIVTLIVVGMLLLISEIFLPGMIAGIAGFLCLALGVAFSFRDFGATQGGIVLLGVTVALVIGFACWLRYFPESGLAKPFVSQGEIGDIGTDRPELVGKEGVTYTPLMPSGTAIIEGRHIDVVTEGEPIEKEQPIKVVEVEGMRVVVRQAG